MRAMLCGLRMPRPLPMGEPRGMTAAHPTCSSRRASDRVVVGVGEHDEPVVDQLLGCGDQLDGVGEEGAVVADDLELHPVGLERLPGQLGGEHRLGGGEAAGSVGQDGTPAPREQVEEGPPGRRVDPPHGHGGHDEADATRADCSDSGLDIPPVPSREARRRRPRRRCTRGSSGIGEPSPPPYRRRAGAVSTDRPGTDRREASATRRSRSRSRTVAA